MTLKFSASRATNNAVIDEAMINRTRMIQVMMVLRIDDIRQRSTLKGGARV
jgi:hypothetical protein